MRIGCIIEARMTSSRLPGKVLLDIHGKPSILRQIERIQRSQYIDTIIVATTVNPQDDELVELLNKKIYPIIEVVRTMFWVGLLKQRSVLIWM